MFFYSLYHKGNIKHICFIFLKYRNQQNVDIVLVMVLIRPRMTTFTNLRTEVTEFFYRFILDSFQTLCANYLSMYTACNHLLYSFHSFYKSQPLLRNLMIMICFDLITKFYVSSWNLACRPSPLPHFF